MTIFLFFVLGGHFFSFLNKATSLVPLWIWDASGSI